MDSFTIPRKKKWLYVNNLVSRIKLIKLDSFSRNFLLTKHIVVLSNINIFLCLYAKNWVAVHIIRIVHIDRFLKEMVQV